MRLPLASRKQSRRNRQLQRRHLGLSCPKLSPKPIKPCAKNWIFKPDRFRTRRARLLGSLEDTLITDENGEPAYDFGVFGFLDGDAPDSVNPSLWRQSQLNAKHGLFEVVDGIYQVRGYDLSNITFIRGETGWIVVDPLITKETAAAAKRLVDEKLGAFPVSALVLTHSHIDHYGGIRGLISEADVKSGVEIIAPDGFVLETVSENVLAGNAMARRATYMYGSLLPKDPLNHVGVGLGQGISSGTPGLLRPTQNITKTGDRLTIDGIEMEFILALGAEAPSEFMFYLPQFNAFCQAEIINHNLHNLYTPRGAKVRDGRIWSQYIDEAIMLYGDKTDVSFGSHHWPVWGQADVVGLWETQRDLYRYIHDQTLRLANQGYTMHEIADMIELPPQTAGNFANRDYYGTVSHNSKAQYQLYFGYFDGNPANLNPLPPEEAGQKFVEYMGGADNVIKRAQDDYDRGEFRFAATALSHVVFAEPDNQAARNLLADVFKQMAYMSESGPWRNFYLSGAAELEQGVRALAAPKTAGPDMIRSIPLNMFFDLMAVRLNGPEAGKKDRDLNFIVSDTGEQAHLLIRGGALHHRMGVIADDVPTLRITKAGLDALNLKQKTVAELIKDGAVEIDGNPLAVRSFFGLIEEPDFWFEIVRP